MIIFGDKNTFGIVYRPDERQAEVKGNYAFPYCHFIIDNQLVGYEDENCFLASWGNSLLYLKKKIQLKKDCLREAEFDGLSDLEILEIVEKSNQLEENYKQEYLYLPKLWESDWYKYSVGMDETLDGFSLLIIEEQGLLKFLWRHNMGDKEKIGTCVTTHEQFYTTIDECLTFLIETYPNVLGNLL